ncbi:restriction endonuclease subunit S [Methanolobus chelungpuianus]|uniref:Type I restriction modification DNA specificity domain-containing protein n=1 Tax=Methanolobus chelungpuianus TaxID=502115 RepID=A0AAE3L1A0_9EURY|nr:restriction endonuclease subunit S [Methanolobus chelungpuianus]MCQ6962978.1 hypothetical protein [Methanolobus chelungpuianus]
MTSECVAESIPAGYKQTEMGVIPEDWQTPTLGSLTVLMTNGFVGTATTHYASNDNGILYIQGYNVEENSFNFHGIKFVTEDFHNAHMKSCLKGGDLLTVQTGDVGLTTIVPESLAGSNCHALIISRFDKRKSFSAFISYYLNSKPGRSRLKLIETGTTMKHLNVGDMLHFTVPLPPAIAEQEAIAQALSDADALIESLEQLIAKKRQIKQGAMQELLTGKRRLPGFEIKRGYKQTELGLVPEDWECVESAVVVTYFGGNAFKSEATVPNGVRWLKIANVGKRKIMWNEISFLPSSYIREYQSYLLQKGDVVMALTRPILDGELKIAKLTSNDLPCLLNQRVAKIVTKHTANLNFIYYELQMSRFVEAMNEAMAGTDPPNIGAKTLGKILLPLPSTLAEQEAIACILSDMDAEITMLEEELEKSRSIKQGMMQELLVGKIRLV